MKGKIVRIGVAFLFFCTLAAGVCFGVKAGYPRRYEETAISCGVDPFLALAIIKAESKFDELSQSKAGAIGLMQLKPSTAEFVCMRERIAYEPDRLFEGEYNVTLGCKYLKYLFGRFGVTETVLAAYNAGEGTVSQWLKDPACSSDGATLDHIPYSETDIYVKKVVKFRKIYEFFY